MMLATDQEFKEQAKKNISLSRSNETNDVISTNAKVSLNWKILMLSVLNIIFFCSFIVFEELILFYSKKMSDTLIYYGFWNTNFGLLKSYMIEIFVEVVNATYFSNTSYEYISTQKFKRRIYEILDAYERNVYEIMNDTPSSPSLMDKDSFVNSLISSQLCENSGPIKNLHDIYK
ncbi:hypothetical protein M9Y10_038286 [Tritrichomonas musculus]|uniref:Uncharacterized protein n=1 Tax=Tritrichomonas musculus TaxID=1915356 RepID=A0ABR2K8R8_9EUKA